MRITDVGARRPVPSVSWAWTTQRQPAADGVVAREKKTGELVGVIQCPECKELVTADGVGHKHGCSQRPAKAVKGNGRKREEVHEITTPDFPSFPSFDSAWPMLVQIEWLKVYRDMQVNNGVRSATEEQADNSHRGAGSSPAGPTGGER